MVIHEEGSETQKNAAGWAVWKKPKVPLVFERNKSGDFKKMKRNITAMFEQMDVLNTKARRGAIRAEAARRKEKKRQKEGKKQVVVEEQSSESKGFFSFF